MRSFSTRIFDYSAIYILFLMVRLHSRCKYFTKSRIWIIYLKRCIPLNIEHFNTKYFMADVGRETSIWVTSCVRTFQSEVIKYKSSQLIHVFLKIFDVLLLPKEHHQNYWEFLQINNICLKTDTILLQCTFYQFQYFIITSVSSHMFFCSWRD